MAAAYGGAQGSDIRSMRRGILPWLDVSSDEKERERLNVAMDLANRIVSIWFPIGSVAVDPAFAVARQAATGKKDLWWRADNIFQPSVAGPGGSLKRVGMRGVDRVFQGEKMEPHEVERMVLDLADVLSTVSGFPWGGIEQAGQSISGAAGHTIGRKPDPPPGPVRGVRRVTRRPERRPR